MENKKTENKLNKENLDKVSSGAFLDDDLNQRGEFAPKIALPVYTCANCGTPNNVTFDSDSGKWLCKNCRYATGVGALNLQDW